MVRAVPGVAGCCEVGPHLDQVLKQRREVELGRAGDVRMAVEQVPQQRRSGPGRRYDEHRSHGPATLCPAHPPSHRHTPMSEVKFGCTYAGYALLVRAMWGTEAATSGRGARNGVRSWLFAVAYRDRRAGTLAACGGSHPAVRRRASLPDAGERRHQAAGKGNTTPPSSCFNRRWRRTPTIRSLTTTSG